MLLAAAWDFSVDSLTCPKMSLMAKVLAVGVSWQLLYIKAYMFEWERRYGIPQDVVMRCARPTFTAPLRWEKRMAAGTYAKQRSAPRFWFLHAASQISLSRKRTPGGTRSGRSSVPRLT